jgi:hypothetical protein
MALHNFRKRNYNSKIAAWRRVLRARQRRRRWNRRSTGSKALAIARRNARLVKPLRPPMRYLEFVTPIMTNNEWATDEPCWMPVVSRICNATPEVGVHGESKFVAPRYTGSNPSQYQVNISSTEWKAAFNGDGLGWHPNGACIWDAMFDNNKHPSTVTGDQCRERLSTVCAISTPLNQLEYALEDYPTKDHRYRQSNRIHSHRLEFNYSIRIADASDDTIHAPVVNRGLQPVNITMMLVAFPVNNHICPNNHMRDACVLGTDPYNNAGAGTNIFRDQIHNMFKWDPLLLTKRSNTEFRDLPLRTGSKSAETGNSVSKVGSFPVNTLNASSMLSNLQTDEAKIRNYPFKVLASKHYRLGTHGTSDILAKYEVDDKFVLKLGYEDFDHITSDLGHKTAYTFDKWEYRVICIHNGCAWVRTPITAASTSGDAPVYPTCTPPSDNTENRVYMKTQVRHWFTSTV